MFCKTKQVDLIGGEKERNATWRHYFQELLNVKEEEEEITNSEEGWKQVAVKSLDSVEIMRIIKQLKNIILVKTVSRRR